MKRLFFYILALLLCSESRSQLSFNHQHFSVQDGLSENNISVIFQDSRGFMWFGTYNGLNKFDGYRFKQFKTLTTIGDDTILENDHINRIHEDKYGFLWIVTYDGKAYRLDPDTEKFTLVSAEKGMPRITHVFTLENGEIWLANKEECTAVRVVTDPETHEMQISLFGTKDGIPGGEIKAITETPKNGCYVLTTEGLARFDPHRNSFKSINPYDGPEEGIFPFSISDNGEQLLIGMNDGSIYHRSHEGSANSPAYTLIGRPFAGETAKLMFLDSVRYIVYYYRQGFVVGNLADQKTAAYPIPAPYKSRLSESQARIFIDSFGDVWLSAESEWILHLYPDSGGMEWLTLPAFHAEGFSSESDFFETSDNTVFIRLWGNKGCYYDRKEKKLEPLFGESGNEPFTNTISRWFTDRQGNIWITPYRKDIEKISIEKRLQIIRLNKEDYLEQNNVHSLFKDQSSRVWLGTKEGRICLLNEDYAILGYLNRDGRLTRQGEVWPRMYAIQQDSDGDIWIGTRGQGLFRLREEADRSGNFRTQQFRLDTRVHNNLGRNHIFCLHPDSYGRIWIATWGGGVNYMTKDHNGDPVFHRLKDYPPREFNRIRHITSDSKNRIWCASPSGVIVINGHPDSLDNPRYTTLTSAGSGAGYLPVNNVNSILRTTSDDIFIGTTGGGMYHVIQEGGEVLRLRNYSSLNDFPSDIIYSMVEDNTGYLWIATPSGIVRLNPETEETNLYGNDHFDPYTLTSNTAILSPKDHVLLGSNKGLVAFDPAQMIKDNYVPPLYFTRLQLFHKDVKPDDEHRILQLPLARTEHLTFNHRQSIFNIEFAALDFRNPKKIRYRYILDGFDKEWTEADASRSASYTNLPAGDYVFKVRSTNSDGVWAGNERHMAISVLPPFWKTPLAYILYMILAIALIFTISYIMYTVYRLKHSIRVDQEMMRVFTNISHEIRTPLTLVHTPLEHLLKTKTFDDDTSKELNLVFRNSGRLLQLVNQLLDFRKIQHNRMPLTLHPIAISEFLRDLIQNFQSLTEQKKVNLYFQTNCPGLIIETDREKIETIFYNLISNAIKYTPSGKSIYIDVTKEKDELRFIVRDEGVGMAKERMSRLFIPFESGENGPNSIQPGTGIGLALVKELCDLLKMEIHFNSRANAGTTITLTTKIQKADARTEGQSQEGSDSETTKKPLIKGSFSEGQLENQETAREQTDSKVSQTQKSLLRKGTVSDGATEAYNERKKILIAEDNQELRHYLRRILSAEYDIIEACNGKVAVKRAQEETPDLIISDLMMPEMDGAAFAEKLKTDIKTSHIPIIILTARSDNRVKAQLFELGVDAFITKPFNSEIFLTRVASILRQREHLYAIYSASLSSITRQKKEDNLTSTQDQQCLEKLMEYLEKNLSVTDIAVEDLCSVSGFNYFLLNKKLKTLIGLSPLEFIREFRIQRAAKLISEENISMKEIAYMVGFSDSRYFSKCFKKKYGVTPSEYKSNIQNTENQQEMSI